MLCDLGDVEKTVGAGKKLDKCAELSQANHLPQVNLADFRHGGDVADDFDAFLSPSASEEATLTRPVSSTSILAPVCSMMPRMGCRRLAIRSGSCRWGSWTVSMRERKRTLGGVSVRTASIIVQQEETACLGLGHACSRSAGEAAILMPSAAR